MLKGLLIVIGLLVGIILEKMITTQSLATFSYIVVSYFAKFDSESSLLINYEGEMEGQFRHSFVKLNQTFRGLPVNATYHVVECGDKNAEPIVFGHGLCENWRVWKQVMSEFCDTHRVVAYDSEGMGQSFWPNVLQDLPKGDSTSFM